MGCVNLQGTLKRKQGISRVYIWCFFICILNGLRFYDKHYR